MERRLKNVETILANYGRRHDDCEKERATLRTTVQEILTWKATIQESTEVNREMIEVARSILKALSWVGTAAKWVTRVGVALGMLWGAFKLVVTLGHAK